MKIYKFSWTFKAKRFKAVFKVSITQRLHQEFVHASHEGLSLK